MCVVEGGLDEQFPVGGWMNRTPWYSRSEGEENFGEFPVTVGGRGQSDARLSRTYARVFEALGSN